MTYEELDIEKELEDKKLTLARAKKLIRILLGRVGELEDNVYDLQENVDDLENALDEIRNGF